MVVRELIELLQQADKEAKVLIRLDGKIYSTAPKEETEDYNFTNDTNEFFIVTDLHFT